MSKAKDMSNSEDQKRRRWVLPLLFASLAMNLLVVGVILGWLISPGGHKRSEIGPVRGLVGEPFVRALPDQQRRAMLRDVMRDAPRIRESRENLRARFEALLGALRADPFDTALVAALLDEQRDVALRRQDIGEGFLLQRLEAMTPEERKTYADRLETSLRRLRR
jgi:uncharacterized membrane protein